MSSQSYSSYVALICLIFLGSSNVVNSQQWTGNYIWGSGCDSTVCCCGTGTLTVTSDSTYVYFSTLSICESTTSTSSWFVINPYSYSYARNLNGQILTYSLTSDSNTLLISNAQVSTCSQTATRSTTSSAAILYGLYSILLASLTAVVLLIPVFS
jgi:hypothetical protein